MLAAAFRIGKVAPRACTRTFSTRHIASKPNAAQHYIASLRSGWRTPLWNLVDSLREPQSSDQIVDILGDNQLSTKQFKVWDQVLKQPDIAKAAALLMQLGFRTRLPKAGYAPKTPIPSWVLLAVVTHLVKTPEHAAGPLMDLVFSHVDLESPEIQGPLLVLTAYHLAQHNLLVPFQRVMEAFLTTPLPEADQQAQFNAFLKALSRTPFRSAEGTNNVLVILQVMDDRALKVAPETYQMLLNKDFTTLGLAQKLFIRVMKEEFKPSPALLEAFLRVFTKHGRDDLALKFYEAIERTTNEANPEGTDEASKARFRARNMMLNSFDRRADALEFVESHPTPTPSTSPLHPDDIHSHSPPTPPTTSSSRTSLDDDDDDPTTTRPNIPQSHYEETSAFHIAAKDHAVSPIRLVSIFVGLPTTPSIVTYTIFIRGLLARGAFRLAEIWWIKLAKQSSLTMDRPALTAGVQALIRNGNPADAFMYLEKYAKKPSPIKVRHPVIPPPAKLHTPVGTKIDPPPAPGENTIEMTTIAMNEVLVAFNRISRPDVVFRLFTHMPLMYGTQPNSSTLSIVLQAARMAVRKDDSLRGVLARIKLLDPFKKARYILRHGTGVAFERAQAVNDVLSCLGHPSRGGMRRYASGVWMDGDALEFGRKVFLQALFGRAAATSSANPGLYERLLKMQSPAAATRQAYDAAPPFLPSAPKPYVFIPPPSSPPPASPKTSPPPASPTTSPPPAPPKKGSYRYRRLRKQRQMQTRAEARARAHASPSPSYPSSEFTLLAPSGHAHYPSISLTNNNVLNYIQLLCVGARVPEIPLVLAWMRELGLTPSGSTLAAALVCWSEVSQQSPLVAFWRKSKLAKEVEERVRREKEEKERAEKAEKNKEDRERKAAKKRGERWVRRLRKMKDAGRKKRKDPHKHNDRAHANGKLGKKRDQLKEREKGTWEFKGGEAGAEDLEEGGEYGKFVRWMREWVGEERMPTAEDIMKWRIVVHKMRTSSTFDGSGGGFTQDETEKRDD